VLARQLTQPHVEEVMAAEDLPAGQAPQLSDPLSVDATLNAVEDPFPSRHAVQSVVAPAAEYLPMGQVLQIPRKEAAPVEYLPASHCVAHAAAELIPEADESAKDV